MSRANTQNAVWETTPNTLQGRIAGVKTNPFLSQAFSSGSTGMHPVVQDFSNSSSSKRTSSNFSTTASRKNLYSNNDDNDDNNNSIRRSAVPRLPQTRSSSSAQDLRSISDHYSGGGDSSIQPPRLTRQLSKAAIMEEQEMKNGRGGTRTTTPATATTNMRRSTSANLLERIQTFESSSSNTSSSKMRRTSSAAFMEEFQDAESTTTRRSTPKNKTNKLKPQINLFETVTPYNYSLSPASSLKSRKKQSGSMPDLMKNHSQRSLGTTSNCNSYLKEKLELFGMCPSTLVQSANTRHSTRSKKSSTQMTMMKGSSSTQELDRQASSSLVSSATPSQQLQRKEELKQLLDRNRMIKVRFLANQLNLEAHLKSHTRRSKREEVLSQSRYQMWSQKIVPPLPKSFVSKFRPPIHVKTAEQHDLIQNAMEQTFLLKDIMAPIAKQEEEEGRDSLMTTSENNTFNDDGISPTQQATTTIAKSCSSTADILIEAMEPVDMEKGTILTEQGILDDHVYIVAKGSLDIQVDGATVSTATAGTLLEETHLLYPTKRNSTLVASSSSDVQLYRLDQQTFRGIVQTTTKATTQQVEITKDASIREDDNKKRALEVAVRSIHPGWTCDYENAFVDVEKDDFLAWALNDYKRVIRSSIGLKDWKKTELLGEGQFGEVWLVQTLSTDVFQGEQPHQFALKSQCKTDCDRGEEALDLIRREVSVLQELQSNPFICNLVHTYEDDDSFHMLMGLLGGGELWNLVHHEDTDGSWTKGLGCEAQAKVYALVIADTLGYMHSKGFIFRDLKPENVMLDGSDGYPVLVDFGFAKQLSQSCEELTYTFCGTPSYVPPEIIKSVGHNAGVDHWQLGVLIYEMISGENPFGYDGIEQVELFRAICEDDFYPLDSERGSGPVVDLIGKLLTKDVSKRLGMLEGRTADILQHAWFEDLNLKKLRQRQVEIPGWKPAYIQLQELDGVVATEATVKEVCTPEKTASATVEMLSGEDSDKAPRNDGDGSNFQANDHTSYIPTGDGANIVIVNPQHTADKAPTKARYDKTKRRSKKNHLQKSQSVNDLVPLSCEEQAFETGKNPVRLMLEQSHILTYGKTTSKEKEGPRRTKAKRPSLSGHRSYSLADMSPENRQSGIKLKQRSKRSKPSRSAKEVPVEDSDVDRVLRNQEPQVTTTSMDTSQPLSSMFGKRSHSTNDLSSEESKKQKDPRRGSQMSEQNDAGQEKDAKGESQVDSKQNSKRNCKTKRPSMSGRRVHSMTDLLSEESNKIEEQVKPWSKWLENNAKKETKKSKNESSRNRRGEQCDTLGLSHHSAEKQRTKRKIKKKKSSANPSERLSNSMPSLMGDLELEEGEEAFDNFSFTDWFQEDALIWEEYAKAKKKSKDQSAREAWESTIPGTAYSYGNLESPKQRSLLITKKT